VSKAKLVKSARECGLGGPIGKIIGNMARERCRLLRPVEYLVDGIFKRRREYSLGHDALAAALFRWAEAHETIVEARRHSLRKVRRLQLVALGVVVAAVLFLFQLVSQRAGTFEALSAFAESDRSGSYSQRLRLLVASLDQVQSIARPFLDVSRSVSSLRNTLELAPVSGDEGEAFGMSPDGSRFALLNGDRLIVNPIRAASSDGPTELRLSPPQSDNNNESATNSPIVPAVGFVGDLGPVAYRNGTLFYWVDQKPYPVALHTLLPPSLRDSNVPLGIDISGGMIRVWPWRFGASEMEFVAISADRRARPQAAFQSSPPRKITWASQLFPTFSISSPVAVYLERERDADRQSTSNFGVRRITLSDGIEGTLGVIQGDPGKAESNNPSDKTTVAQELFLRSIAFPSNAPGVVVRSERGALEYFPDPKATTRRFHIPDAMQSDPQRPAMFSARPLLAAHKSSDREWKFAWMGPNGINVMKSTEGDRLGAPVVWPPLLPGDSGVDAARSLIFSKDGQYLILTVQRGFRESLKYRLFDLSAARRATIAAMDQSALKQEACRVAKLERAAGASVAQTFVRTLGCD
jgi:hypothetical protein